MNIEKQSMENRCAMIPLGSNKPCKNKPVKNSTYCKGHKYILKHNKSKVVRCLKCNKGTTAKYQICDKCDGKNVREKHRWFDKIKPFKEEIKRLNRIEC